MLDLEKLLDGGDLRSIGESNKVVELVNTQERFDSLFELLFHADRKIKMRAADAVEKITIKREHFLKKHKKVIIALCKEAKDKELKWHLALLASRLNLTNSEFTEAWAILSGWAKNKSESRIVRVNSLQGLFQLYKQKEELKSDLSSLFSSLEAENIPSISARIKKLQLLL